MVVFNRDAKFTSEFWKDLFGGMRTQLNCNSAYHHQINRQIERKKQILEDMLSMYIMKRPTKWDYFLHLA